jgi:hypothetical protein
LAFSFISRVKDYKVPLMDYLVLIHLHLIIQKAEFLTFYIVAAHQTYIHSDIITFYDNT